MLHIRIIYTGNDGDLVLEGYEIPILKQHLLKGKHYSKLMQPYNSLEDRQPSCNENLSNWESNVQ